LVCGGRDSVALVRGRDCPVRAVRAVVALGEDRHFAGAGVERLAEAKVELREGRLALAVAAEVRTFAERAGGRIGAAERRTIDAVGVTVGVVAAQRSPRLSCRVTVRAGERDA